MKAYTIWSVSQLVALGARIHWQYQLLSPAVEKRNLRQKEAEYFAKSLKS